MQLDPSGESREPVAMKRHHSPVPIGPGDVQQELPGQTTQGPQSNLLAAAPQSGPDLIPLPALSFLSRDHATGQPVLDLALPGGPVRRFGVTLACCPNPCCDCRRITLTLLPIPQPHDADNSVQLDLWLDKRRVRPGKPSPVQDKALARAASSLLTPEDWNCATQWYADEKRSRSEPDSASGLNAPFPDEVLRTPSILVGYDELFRYSRPIEFESEGIPWISVEMYCTDPECNCRQALLCLMPRPPEMPPGGLIDQAPGTTAEIFLDYSSGEAIVRNEATSGTLKAIELLGLVRRAHPELPSHLRRRHRVLRGLHAEARREADGMPPAPPPALSVPTTPKVGRNEPCPCGSGRKFKRCCGA